MTLDEAVKLRHAVRQYLPTELTKEQVDALQAKTAELNERYGLHLQLILNDEKAFDSRMAHYGKFSGVKNLFALVAQKECAEDVGRASAEIVLFAQTLGLNTCIVAMTFQKTENFKVAPGEKVFGAIALGYGQTSGVQHPMKTPEKISPDYTNAPDWFKKGIDYVLLAPTGLNQCRVEFRLNKDESVTAKLKLGLSTKVDLGITKYFFELGAGRKVFAL